MNRKQHSGVFMMEMIMVVFFFILCASICILVFVRADRMSRQADDLNQGVLAAQSVAEVWKAEAFDGLKTRFQAQISDDGDSLVIGFGKDGETAKADDAVYVVTLSQTGAGESLTPDTAQNDTQNDSRNSTQNKDDTQNKAGTQNHAQNRVQQAEIVVSRDGESVYTLSVSRHESAE